MGKRFQITSFLMALAIIFSILMQPCCFVVLSPIAYRSAENENLSFTFQTQKSSIKYHVEDSNMFSFIHFRKTDLKNLLQSLLMKRRNPILKIRSNPVTKQIYQIESQIESFSALDIENQHLSFVVVLYVALLFLFSAKFSKQCLIQPHDKLQRKSLSLLLLFLLFKESHACPVNCSTCLNSTCTLCLTSSYKVSNNCNYYTRMSGCSSADGLNCNNCSSGYYLDASNICKTCFSAIFNCAVCTRATGVSCNICNVGYAISSDNLTCDSCPFYLPGCSTCSSKISCISCVNQTLIVNGLMQCELCSAQKIGCLLCNTASCLQCSNGYYLLPIASCTPCNTTFPGCIVCPSSTICTQCINTALVLINNYCISCGAIFPFCTTCQPTVCLTCQPSFFLNVNKKCECMKGSLVESICMNVAGCEGAVKFRSKSFCTKCNPDIFNFNPGTVTCDCKQGFHLNYQCSLLDGCIAMIFVNSTQVCVMCNLTRNFIKNQTWCSCEVGYSLNQKDKNCYEICGDGKVFYLDCDDGNTNDFDGCSSTCTIQPGFKCVGGNQNSSSKCLNALGNFLLEVSEMQNIGEYGIGKFEFNIKNFHPYLNLLNWTKVFSLDIQQSHNVTSISIKGSRVVFTVDYYENLEGMPATLYMNLTPEYFQYPKTVNITFFMISSTAPLVLASYPNPEILDILSIILLVLAFLSFLILLISPCYHKMIALETFTILQLCNIAPNLVNSGSIILRVFDNLSYVNGFGKQLFANETYEAYGETFEDMSLPKTFTQIMLINEGLILAVTLIFVLAHLLKKIIYRFNAVKEMFRHFINVYCCNLVFSVTMSLYLIFCIALACNNHRVYEKTYKGRLNESTQKYQFISNRLNLTSILIVIALIAVVGMFNIFVFAASEKLLKTCKSKIIQIIYKQTKRINKNYVVVFLANHFICFSLLAGLLFVKSPNKVFIYLAISLPFFLYILVMRPYSCSTDNFGIYLGQIISLIFLVGLSVKQYFWIVKTPLSLYYQFYLCIVIVCLLCLHMLISIIRLIAAWYEELTRKEQPIKVKKAAKLKKQIGYDQPKHAELERQNYLDLFHPKELVIEENHDISRLKEKLRNDLYQKRKTHKDFTPFKHISKPALEIWLSDVDFDQR